MKEVKRPWGKFKRFVLNKKCTVKVLFLKPGQELSLQTHKKRNEMWYFLDKARVELGKKEFAVKSGDIVKIKKKMPHRAIAGKNKVRILEISLGKFEEADEVRLEDEYGRK